MNWEDYEEVARQVKENRKKYETDNASQKKEDIHGDCDYVWAPEKGAATIIYALVMFFGSIFNERILLWIVATVIYINFISRNKKG